MIVTHPHHAFFRPEAGHIGTAQEGQGLPAAQLCREFHPVGVRCGRGQGRRDPGDRRRRALPQPRRDPDRDPHGRRQWLRQGRWSGSGGILSTPAASHIIRKHGAIGGLILSASHNPGGPDEDFGIKYNIANGGPAPEKVTEAIFARSKDDRPLADASTPPTSTSTPWASTTVGGMPVEVVDPVADYAELMEELFDFDAIRALIRGGFRMAFDAHERGHRPLCASRSWNGGSAFRQGTVRNGTPLEDFGGLHPDPNLVTRTTCMRR